MNKMSAKLGRSGSNKFVVVLGALLAVTIVITLATFVHVANWESNDEQYLLRASEQRILSQDISGLVGAAARGDKDAFSGLRRSRDRFEQIMKELKNGSAEIGLPASPKEVAGELKQLENTWLELRQNADEILSNQESILLVREYVGVISELIPHLHEASQEVIETLVKHNAAQQQVYIATEQLMLGQRIHYNVNQVLEGGQATAAGIDQFTRDADRFGRVLEGLLNGDRELNIKRVDSPKAKAKLQDVAKLFGALNDHAEEIIDTTPAVLPALESAASVNQSTTKVAGALEQLMAAYRQSPGRFAVAGLSAGPGMIMLLGAVAVIFLVLMGIQMLVDSRQREDDSKGQNETNQKAILRLLDEMGNLADGDLTVQATVTEDITGAIADSINYAIEALRSLVTTINETSEQVSASAQESRATAMHLAEASGRQAQQITQATTAIKEMTRAIDEVSRDATESAEVAQRSTEIAGKGAATVRSTIQGMDAIREQIQETAKRIKRLGESSQEIGDIVELIDDIADQTNILALNAAMQAAMAGEAGRGFAVVADEVQRLAERSSNATKQIEALVKTIQADTHEAVSSMEASTSGVVNGAKLAEDAGEALMEIENVSNYIADLTKKIAESAQHQSGETAKINSTMGVIQEITNQTSEGTSQTASSIGALADLADDLQHSVAGFRLPA